MTRNEGVKKKGEVMETVRQKPELLAPAGNLAKLKTAVTYGADAVYIGGEEFSLRTAADNFTVGEIAEGVEYAHDHGRKVYLTANIIPHNRDIAEYEKFLRELEGIDLDAVILSDLGMFSVTRELAPRLNIHISTQANNVNWKSAETWRDLGAKRVILAREMSLEEIKEIRERVPDLELEAFVHGAMCISYSGRCLLSNYMAGRDGNKGECAHPCRWKYFLMEQQRPGEYMPVFENERGTFIYNSKDLCMLPHIDKLIESGLTSFKIEGRVKSEFYVATVVKAYRRAIDDYFAADPGKYEFDSRLMEEVKKVSHRDYTTGFYFGRPGGTEQHYESSSYIRDYDMVGVVTAYDKQTKMAEVVQKNRFFKGDELEFLRPYGDFCKQTIEYMTDDNGNEIEVANHPQSKVYIKTDFELEPDTFVRMEKKKR